MSLRLFDFGFVKELGQFIKLRKLGVGLASLLELWSILVWRQVCLKGLLSLRKSIFKSHVFQLCIDRLRPGFAASVLKGNLRNPAVNRELIVEGRLRERSGVPGLITCPVGPLSRRMRCRCFQRKLIFRWRLIEILKGRCFRLLQFKLRFLVYYVTIYVNIRFPLLIDPVVRIHIIYDVWKENGPFCLICTQRCLKHRGCKVDRIGKWACDGEPASSRTRVL